MRARVDTADLALRAGIAGAALGLVVGIVEVAFGPSILPWIGDKHDTAGLGTATVVLAVVALASAAWLRSERATAPERALLLALGMLVPGLVCFTTAGRLWWAPGALVCGAALVVLWQLRGQAGRLVRAARRRWADILLSVLGLYLVALAATGAGSIVGVGTAGGLALLVVAAAAPRLPRRAIVAAVAVATVPAAVVAWWSLVTPAVALQAVTLAVVRPAGGDGRSSWPAPGRRGRWGRCRG